MTDQSKLVLHCDPRQPITARFRNVREFPEGRAHRYGRAHTENALTTKASGRDE